MTSTGWQLLWKKFGTIREFILNDMLYYSHVNEDNRIEESLFSNSGCTTAVAVAGSGERVMALLNNKQCGDYYVIDVNEEALFLLQLKLAALGLLSVEDYYRFTGHFDADMGKRRVWFDTVKTGLSIS